MKAIFFSFVCIGFLISSCNKYPDGPSISLASKKARLSNTWRIDQYFENGVNKTSDALTVFKDYTLTINTSGDYTISYKLFNLFNYSETGTWAFISSKEKVLFTRTSPTPVNTSEWTILRLKEKELWGQYIDSSNTVKVQLIPY